MEKQHEPDVLDRALTDLYHADIPEGYRAAWREAVKREEQTQMNQMHKPVRSKFLWRVALPIAAALVLVFGAITAGNLIPTVVTDTLMSSAPAPLPDAKKGAGDNLYAADTGAMESFAPSTAEYDAKTSLAMQSPGGDVQYADSRATGTSSSTGTDNATGTTPTSGAKIVRTADLTIATTMFDADSAAVTNLTERMGGYIASVSLNGEASSRMDRVAYYSLRIPSAKLDEFLNGLDGIGRVTYRYETSTDLSTQYADTSMRLKTQQDKMTRLQELIKQATDVSDLLEIESEIADTQYEIDSLQSSLLTIDRDVDKSAVTVTLQEQSAGETAQAVELTLWQRLGSGFEASIKGLGVFLQNLLVFLAMLLPALVPIAVVVIVIVLIVRARRKHRLQKSPAQGDAPAEKPADTQPTEKP